MEGDSESADDRVGHVVLFEGIEDHCDVDVRCWH
jgi:hypothetical protein